MEDIEKRVLSMFDIESSFLYTDVKKLKRLLFIATDKLTGVDTE